MFVFSPLVPLSTASAVVIDQMLFTMLRGSSLLLREAYRTSGRTWWRSDRMASGRLEREGVYPLLLVGITIGCQADESRYRVEIVGLITGRVKEWLPLVKRASRC
jgi:hypothetical protein